MTKTPLDWNGLKRARFGLFIHYGLYSMQERGEWVMNREAIPRPTYAALADSFDPENFDAETICDLAMHAGMRYIIFTTMHHDGFRLYDSALSDFNSARACGRDLTGEIVAAARARGLKIGLYHSLNNWMDAPDAVDALEDEAAYNVFIANTFARLRELLVRFNPIDVLWYDGWWPFDARGWQAEAMNAMAREIQPHLLFNGRNGLAGDFSTPEGHLGAPSPWRPWEACITMNGSWGFHAGDHDWKSPGQIVDMLATCAQGRGNLLLNIGPRGDGSIPAESVTTLQKIGAWLEKHGEAVFDTDTFDFDLQSKGAHRGDWCGHGPLTAKGNALYLFVRRWPGQTLTLSGLECTVQNATLLGDGRALDFVQEGGKIEITGLPTESPDEVCPVIRFDCDRPPSLYLCGGMRTPRVAHPHYDPCPSDIAPGKTPGA